MEKNQLQKLISEDLSTRQIAKKLLTSQSTVKYWLKKYHLKTNRAKFNSIRDKTNTICRVCKKEVSQDQFYRKNQNRYICKNCQNKDSTERQNAKKIKMVLLKGSQCNKCGLKLKDSHPSVFEFHHIDPKTKEKNFGSIKGWKWERIEEELKKCVLLCANCHRLEHVKQSYSQN